MRAGQTRIDGPYNVAQNRAIPRLTSARSAFIAMIVLCSNPGCGAVLRVAASTTPTQAVMHLDDHGCYFACPRCAVVTRLTHEIQPRRAATGTEAG